MAKKKILFVCTGNIDRSPTAEALFSKSPIHEARSAGTWRHAYRRVSRELVEWADVIFVMEDHHKESIVDSFPEAKDKIIVLDIPDIYPRHHPELVALLKEKLSKYLEL